MNIFEKIFIRIKLKHIPVWSISPFLMPEKIFFFNFCKYNFDNHDAKITFSIYKEKNYFTIPTFKGSNFTVNVNKLNKIIKKIK